MTLPDLQHIGLYYFAPACGIISLICATLVLESRARVRRRARQREALWIDGMTAKMKLARARDGITAGSFYATIDGSPPIPVESAEAWAGWDRQCELSRNPMG